MPTIKEDLVKVILEECKDSALKRIELHIPDNSSSFPVLVIQDILGNELNRKTFKPSAYPSENFAVLTKEAFSSITTRSFNYFFIVMENCQRSKFPFLTGWKATRLEDDGANWNAYCHC